MKIEGVNFIECVVNLLIILDYPCPNKGSKENQFAPFRGGVNELIVK